ncbi:hypothetical protein ABTX61_12850 [Amycolatopsis japonica]|uniref:hypothetical protein n=1 Tax=Amycolatopsis japonica TaxID=208439 RepID=UPI0033248EDE
MVVAALAVSSPVVVVPAVVAAVGTVPATLVAPLPAGSPVIAEVAAVTGRVAGAVAGDVAEPVLVVVVVVGVDADAEVVVAACRGCTSPDTSDVTVFSGLVPAVVSVAWSLVREGPVSSSAWATPTPRSIKPPASNPAWMDRFTQVRMRNLSTLC